MPSLVTHYLHGMEVKKLIKNKYLDKNKYAIFNQSHDFLYYSFIKEYKDAAKKGHHKNTREFILNIIRYIKDNNIESRKFNLSETIDLDFKIDLIDYINNYNQFGPQNFLGKLIKDNNLEKDGPSLAFLYGIINHYVLDSTCHPYIFYYSGVYNKKKKETRKYIGLHNVIEKGLDKLVYEHLSNKKFKKLNVAKEVLKDEDLSSLHDLINYAYSETYNIDNIYDEYEKCYRKMRRFNRFVVIDRTGLKRILYCIIDGITFKHFGILSCYSTSIKPKYDLLNSAHNNWKHPVMGTIKDKSFLELFDESIKKSVSIIENVNEILYDNKDLKILDKLVKDVDYSTGLEIKDNKRMTYFYL